MDKDTILVSQKEYDKKLKQFNELKKKLNDISRSKIAAAYNDTGNTWHDNFAYEQLDMQEEGILNQLSDMQESISKYKVIEAKSKDNKKVDVYDKIQLKFIYDINDYEIVELELGSDDIDTGISMDSPLGRQIYMKTYGETVEYEVNGNIVKVQIMKKLN